MLCVCFCFRSATLHRIACHLVALVRINNFQWYSLIRFLCTYYSNDIWSICMMASKPFSMVKPQPNGLSIWISACILHNAIQHFIMIDSSCAYSGCMCDTWNDDPEIYTHTKNTIHRTPYTEQTKESWNYGMFQPFMFFVCDACVLTIYISFCVFWRIPN